MLAMKRRRTVWVSSTTLGLPPFILRPPPSRGPSSHYTLWWAMREILKESIWPRRAFNLHVSTCVCVKIEIETYHVP
jgi:hypothetical protein